MKNLTQLPWSGKGSKAKNDNTLGRMRGGIRSRIGSMSLKNTSLFGVILALLLTFGVGQMWGYTLYLYTGSFTDWENDGVGFRVWTGSENVNFTSLGNHWWSCTTTKTGTMYIKRYSGSTDHNQFTASSVSSTNNVFYVSGWNNSGGALKYYIKHPWDGGSWTWQTMTFNSANTFRYTGIYKSGNGANVNQDKGDSNYLTPSNTSNVNDKVPAIWTYTPSSNSLRIDPAYTLTVTNDGYGSSSGSVSKGIKMSTKYAISASSPSTGYHFNNWTKVSGGTCTFDNASSASTNVTVTGDESATVQANFALNTYTVAYNANDAQYPGTATGSTSSSSHTYGTAKALTSNGFSRAGYTFAGWATSPTGDVVYTDGQSVTNLSSTQGATVTLYAKWTENLSTVTLTASPSGKGSFTIGGAAATSTTAGVTTTRSVTAVPISGYRFSSWSISGGASISNTTDNPTTVTGGGAGTAATLTATFVEDVTNYLLKFGKHYGSEAECTVTAVNSSTGTALTTNTSYLSGTGVTVTATCDDEDYKLSGWYNAWNEGSLIAAASTTNPYTFTLSAATNIYAHYVRKTTSITLNKNGGSGGTTGPVTATHGNTTLSTNPLVLPGKSGYTFTGYWTESSGGVKVIDTDGTLVASVSGYTKSGNKKWDYDDPSLTLYAQWTENKYTVSITGGTTSSTTAGISTTGTATVSLPEGKKFTGWSLGTGVTLVTGTTSSETITFHASQASTVTATFTDRAQVKMYFAKPKSWSTSIKAYAWYSSNDAVKNATWPGVALTTETYNCVEYYSYQYYTEGDGIGGSATGNSTWNQIIFSDDGNDTRKTGDLTIADGHIYHWSSSGTGLTTGSDWYVEGSFNSVSHWNDADYPIIFDACGNIGTVTISSLTATAQEFKIYRLSTDTWYRYSTAAMPLNTEVTLVSTDGDNNTFTPLATADFTFTLDISTPASPKLTVAAVDVTSYSATLAVNGNGSTSPAAGNITLHQITPTYITATPDEGYYFVNWTVTGNAAVTSTTDNPTTASATGNGGTITANFTDKWNLKGDQWDSWGTYKPLPNTGTNTFGTTIDLVKGTKYQFKVVQRGASDTWYGNTNGAGNHVFSRGDGAFTTVADGMNNNLEITPDVSGTYTFSINTSGSTPKITITYQAAYTVTFGYGTGGSAVTASGSTDGAFTSGAYVKAGDNVTFTQSASSGYTFAGWYDASTGGSAVPGMSDNVLDAIAANANVYAQYTANTYTVSFNVNGGTASTPDSKSVTFSSAYGELPGGMTHASKVFKGWYTLSSGGTLVTASTIVSTAGNHTLYAQYEDIYTVNIDYKCSGAKLRNSTSTTASATAMAAEISAPEIVGYEFYNWTGTNATFGSATSATTTVKATAATTITANYTAIPTVYFKNNLGWEHVYVTFDCNWVTAGGATVPSNNTKPYFEMTQLGTSDIFSCRIPAAYVTSSYAGWKGNIAFDNHGFAATSNVGSNTAFNAGEFLGRGDFDPSATMFIPYDGDSETRNGGTYYRTGCWMKYNSTDPGYKLYANTYREGSGGSAVTGTPVLLEAGIAGGFEFKATVSLGEANYTYGIMLHKEYTKNSNAIWYTNTGTIYASTTTLPWDFTTDGASENGTRCGLHTEATGNYEITVSFATGKPMVNVTYPVSVNDWRLVYKDRATWSNGAHTAAWQHPSRVIKAKADAEDIVSFYVSKAVGANATVELQKCTAIDPGTGAQTWVKQSDVDLSEITSTGIYNFKVTQNGSKIASAAFDGGYVGNFYIRTDASDGGWSNYKTSGTNTMTYSEYSLDHGGEFGPYSHYFMRYVTAGNNIKFCIANDYSECISDTIVGDTYTDEYIEASGNVRFMWYWETNKIGRAYISGSSIVSDRFLVLEGDDKMFNEAGTALTTAAGGKVTGLNEYEMKFTDDQNWIYEATVKAKPGARIKLTAEFNDEIQYFYGKEGARSTETTDLLLGGSDTEKYKIRIVYDFKTNRLMKAFMPDGAINTDLEINADLMIIREAQNDAQQITFGANGALSEVKTVYGAMKFNKYNVNNKSKEGGHGNLEWSRYKRDLFYISFPFDVKLSDVFGFGTYGKHWIIEYYDGKERAANGFWAETETFWKFVMPSQRSSFTMKANEGYILALDLDEMTESSSIWNNDVQDVYIYFPSNGDVNDIEATNKLVTIDQTGYECTIGPRFDGGDDRTKKDSYWHCIGVPGFANYNRDLTVTNGGATIDWSDDDGTIDWSTASFPYLYEWNSTDNSLSVTTSATFAFKPMYSYMVQYAGASIYWSQINSTPSGVVARQKDAPTNIEFRLELQQGEQKADQAFVRLTDDELVTTGYDFNYDLSKEFNGGKANIYTMITSVTDNQASLTEAAGNVLPMSEQTTVVPVGVKIATNGDYTFSIPEGTEGVGVTLIDQETGIRTSLSALDYTVSLEAGTYNDRFVLEISPIHNMPTEQSAVSDQQTDVRKVLIDGLLYIVRDNKMYDARGAMVMEK